MSFLTSRAAYDTVWHRGVYLKLLKTIPDVKLLKFVILIQDRSFNWKPRVVNDAARTFGTCLLQPIQQYETAIEYYENALHVAQEQRDDDGDEERMHERLADACSYMSLLENIIKYIALELGGKRKSGARKYLCLYVDQYQTAIEYYQRARNLALEREDKRGKEEAYLICSLVNIKHQLNIIRKPKLWR